MPGTRSHRWPIGSVLSIRRPGAVSVSEMSPVSPGAQPSRYNGRKYRSRIARTCHHHPAIAPVPENGLAKMLDNLLHHSCAE